MTVENQVEVWLIDKLVPYERNPRKNDSAVDRMCASIVIPVLITPCTSTTEGAVPFLKQVRGWPLEDFRSWVKGALQVLRDLRRDFPGPGNLFWRTDAADRLKAARIAPDALKAMLGKTAADCMQVVSAKEEEEA